MHRGYIKAWRGLPDHPIWKLSTSNQRSVLMALLWLASYKEKQWFWKGEKFIVKPGQMITSLESIAEKSGYGVTIQNVRTALARFEKLEFLTNESTKQGRLITIINWGTYQSQEDSANIDDNSCLTDAQQTPNRQPNIYQEDKKEKNSGREREERLLEDSQTSAMAGAKAAAAPPPKIPKPKAASTDHKTLTYIQEFIEWYRIEHLAIIGTVFIPNWKRDASIIKIMYEGLDKNMEMLKERATVFLRAADTWPSNDKSLEFFQRNANRGNGKRNADFDGLKAFASREQQQPEPKNVTPKETEK
jgi:hypothetical protein